MAKMTQQEPHWSSALYALLLKLYPRGYLREHGEEMLQNFEDIAQASTSRLELWIFISADLLVSVVEQQMKAMNSLRAYVIGVILVWAAIFAYGYFERGPTPGRPALHVFGGFMLGMLAMYIATRFYAPRRDNPGA